MEFVRRRHVANGAVQTNVVAMGNEFLRHCSGFVKTKRHAGANTLPLDRGMKALQLAVGLRIVRRGPHVRHAGEPNEFLEILGNELRTVVRDDGLQDAVPWPAGQSRTEFPCLVRILWLAGQHPKRLLLFSANQCFIVRAGQVE